MSKNQAVSFSQKFSSSLLINFSSPTSYTAYIIKNETILKPDNELPRRSAAGN